MLQYSKEDISYFAKTNFRNDGRLFGIKQRDRVFHTFIFGKTGTGKSNTIRNFIFQDIIHNRGLCVFDIHNDIIPHIINHIPLHRQKDIVYLDIANPKMEFQYNPLKHVSYEKRSLVASGILETFKKLWRGAWGVKLEHILRYILLTLLDQKHSDFSDIPRIIHNEEYRNECIKNVINDDIQEFWFSEFPKYSKNDVIPILNKVGGFLAHPSIKRFLVQNTKEVSLRHCMDSNKILLINLNKGALGSDVAHLLGSLLLTSLTNAGFSRSNIEEYKREVFHIYLDEFQNYTSLSIINLLSEIRKYGITLTMATQYLSILDSDIRDGVLGNVGNLISFRLGQQDAKYMAQEFHPVFKTEDFVNLANYDIYLRLMIDGKPSQPFSAQTIKYFDYF